MRLFRVRGRSMLPTLHDGDYVIGRRYRVGRSRLNSGQVVCVDHPDLGWLIKRVGKLSDAGVQLLSDGQTGNEHLGYIQHDDVRYLANIRIGKRGVQRIRPASQHTQELT
ncbi:MAG: S24/S26 family peptidase [Pseudomonadota bacterium]